MTFKISHIIQLNNFLDVCVLISEVKHVKIKFSFFISKRLSHCRAYQPAPNIPSTRFSLTWSNARLSEPGSVVGIATGYGLDGPKIESRWGREFSAPVQTNHGAHPASCTMGTGSFPGVKSGRGLTQTPHSLLVPWSWKGTAIPLLPLWAVRPVQSRSVPVQGCTLPLNATLKLTVLDGKGKARHISHHEGIHEGWGITLLFF